MGFPRQEYWDGLPFPPPGAFQVALVVKNPPANEGDIRDTGSIPGSGRSPEGVPGNPLQYACLSLKKKKKNLAKMLQLSPKLTQK